ncbi:hypothetical protein [Arthrobacter sp. 9MFCol3.1]|uniref:hypothetical protein n=1 Tax=Arthrobacter sp. 9MFCol3.1 TaxID=1150398 RepID=UPI00047CBFCF|nr:hypothetical protein [Arthrobacter sp. 9MFCol3.1]
MDGETIRLIVVACGAIVAGLLGALIAGAFNSRNTLATIEAARVAAEAQRDADREVEHERWLRDRRVEVYSKFLEEAHDLGLHVAWLGMGYSNDTSELAKKARNLSLLNLRVLAPTVVLDAAQDVMRSTTALTTELLAIKERTASSTEAYDAATKRFNEYLALLEVRISNDLGIDVVA